MVKNDERVRVVNIDPNLNTLIKLQAKKIGELEVMLSKAIGAMDKAGFSEGVIGLLFKGYLEEK